MSSGSAIVIPEIPVLTTIGSDRTVYIAPPNNGISKSGTSTGWTGLTFGNDSTGDGSLSAPFATLRRAWQFVQGYNIQGNAIVYIQFQKGIYGYTFDPSNAANTNPFPDNLYHPQGDRIVIQGDPLALKQRYLYRVKSYGWDFSRWAQYGHTGTVNLWKSDHYGDVDASWGSGSGTTAHGFTAEDELGYVAIVNAGMGAADGRYYADPRNGVHSGAKYSGGFPHNWGRAHFNHGLSYEEAAGVWGLARIEGASANPNDLQLQFKTANLDGRACTFPFSGAVNGTVPGGLGTGLIYGGIDSNYPEPQYSNPVGFYGPTHGVSSTGESISSGYSADGSVGYGVNAELGVNLTYPSINASEVHVTDDPHVVSNYPVVIKIYSTSGATTTFTKPVPFVLDGCIIRSIRNLMLVNGDLEASSRTVTARGKTLGAAIGLDGMRYFSGDALVSAGPCMVLRRGSQASIRHLGMLGWGNTEQDKCLVVLGGSRLATDPCIEVDQYGTTNHGSSAGASAVYARLGEMHNTPVLMTTHGGGIEVREGSELVTHTGSALAPKSEMYADQTVWCQNLHGSGLRVANSKASVGSACFVNSSLLPSLYQLKLNIPVASGSTVYGEANSAFYYPEVFDSTSGKGSEYTSVVGYKYSSSGRTPFLRITSVSAGRTYASGQWWGDGSVSWSGGYTPLYNQQISFRGYKLADSGMDTDLAIKTWLNTGNTLEFYAFSDSSEGATVSGQLLAVDRNGIRLSVFGGSSYTGTFSTYGGTYAFGGTTTENGSAGAVSLYDFNANATPTIIATDGADVLLNGSVCLHGKCQTGVSAVWNSKVQQISGNLSVKDFTHSGVLAEHNSVVDFSTTSGSVVVKHPVGYGSGIQLSENGYGLNARYGGEIRSWSPIACVSVPLSGHATTNESGQHNGLWSNKALSSQNVDAALSVVMPPYLAVSNSGGEFRFSGSSNQLVTMAWDGGNFQEASSANAKGGASNNGSQLWGMGSFAHVWNVSQGYGSMTPRIMTRGGWGSGSNAQWLYNSPMGATMWFENSESGWVSSTSAASTTVNAAYKEKLGFGGATNLNSVWTTPQRAAAFNASAPGYSGPGFTNVDSLVQTNFTGN
jgi:hypothetical protein